MIKTQSNYTSTRCGSNTCIINGIISLKKKIKRQFQTKGVGVGIHKHETIGQGMAEDNSSIAALLGYSMR